MFASIRIDGQKLKAAREAKGRSIAEIATSLTLSREQVRFIEDGGDKPFYTLAHKLLAVRKYANALGIAYDEVVIGEGASLTLAAPEAAPPMVHMHDYSQPAIAADLRLAAVARNAAIRRQTMMAGVILCVLLALYAKVRGSEDADDAQDQNTAAVGRAVYDSPPEPVAASAAGLKEAEAETEAPPIAAGDSDSEDSCPQEQAGAALKTWSPSYQRKSDGRLYVISPHGSSLCVADVSGNAKRIHLKPMVGQTVPGKPPYTVRADKLSQVEMYFQGLRVKVPVDTNALRLIPARSLPPQPADQTAAATSGA